MGAESFNFHQSGRPLFRGSKPAVWPGRQFCPSFPFHKVRHRSLAAALRLPCGCPCVPESSHAKGDPHLVPAVPLPGCKYLNLPRPALPPSLTAVLRGVAQLNINS